MPSLHTDRSALAPDGPFSLNDESAYAAWRAAKLRPIPKSVAELRVAIGDLADPSPAERAAL